MSHISRILFRLSPLLVALFVWSCEVDSPAVIYSLADEDLDYIMDLPEGYEACRLQCEAGTLPDYKICQCVPKPCDSDEDCGGQTLICLGGVCVVHFPVCPPASNCHDGQYCDEVLGRCVGEPIAPDGDAVDGEALGDHESTDKAEGEGGEDCTINGCAVDEGQCNPLTGRCEWCDPFCPAYQECNYSASGWYCDIPCDPACPDGYACSASVCVPLKCPRRCGDCQQCNGATGYVCETIPGCSADGDQDDTEGIIVGTPPIPTLSAPVPTAQCMPPASDCIEGITPCCSGACVMGYCL